MKLVVGLGNPGAKYKGTRHNVGFMTMDEVAYQEKFDFDKALFDAVFAQVQIGGEKVIFMKPLTFMNLSGEAIRPLMNYFKIGRSFAFPQRTFPCVCGKYLHNNVHQAASVCFLLRIIRSPSS